MCLQGQNYKREKEILKMPRARLKRKRRFDNERQMWTV